jgi:Mn2+/Fe2+ NRAMP family transporter
VSRVLSVLFWSVIAAAFIGPGTVTTAASAGASHGTALVWALVFSTFACLLLQEAAARLTVVSGHNLGQALRGQYRQGLAGFGLLVLVLGAVVLGCAAYEAGNILGGVAGAALGIDVSTTWLTLACGGIAAALLFAGAPQTVAKLLGLLVAVMGVAFLVTAWQLAPSWSELLRGGIVPRIPEGSEVLVLGLVGTTVVPYNLFLGSGLAQDQQLDELRFGLTVAVVLGGIISVGIVVVGTAVEGPFSFAALADVLADRLGPRARSLFALGLFAAGLSSAITAPLAAAITTRSMVAHRAQEGWEDRSFRFRGIWMAVLAVGVAFGIGEVRPVPVILLAQALNGVLLPVVAIFLLLAINDRRLMGPSRMNGAAANTLMIAVVAVTTLLGVTNVARAAAGALRLPRPDEGILLAIAALVCLGLAWPVGRALARRRRATADA